MHGPHITDLCQVLDAAVKLISRFEASNRQPDLYRILREIDDARNDAIRRKRDTVRDGSKTTDTPVRPVREAYPDVPRMVVPAVLMLPTGKPGAGRMTSYGQFWCMTLGARV